MGDWSLPTLTTNYDEVLTKLADKDFDAASLFLNEPTNHINGFIRLVRSPVKFQERSAGAWADRVLDITGGGTGGATAAAARASLGIGTMGVQASDAVTITGGSLAGSGAGITALNASNLASGTAPAARLGAGGPDATVMLRGDSAWAQITNAVVAAAANIDWTKINKTGSSLANLTTRSAGDLSSGTLHVDRMGSGASATKFLRGDNTWQEVSVVKSVHQYDVDVTGGGTITISPALTDYTKAVANFIGIISTSGGAVTAKFTSNTTFVFNAVVTAKGTLFITEYKNVG